jgi:hypothetical protein
MRRFEKQTSFELAPHPRMGKRKGVPAMAKLTAAQIKVQTKKILEAIEQERRRYEGQKNVNFAALKPKDIERKLKRVKSPMLSWQAWSSSAPTGGTIKYNVGIWNPGPDQLTQNLYAHAWVGSGYVDPNVGTFLLNVDTRFPRLTEPAFDGAKIGISSSLTISFELQVPTGVQPTNYLGNTCVMQLNFRFAGVYLDRGVWPFTVT